MGRRKCGPLRRTVAAPDEGRQVFVRYCPVSSSRGMCDCFTARSGVTSKRHLAPAATPSNRGCPRWRAATVHRYDSTWTTSLAQIAHPRESTTSSPSTTLDRSSAILGALDTSLQASRISLDASNEALDASCDASQLTLTASSPIPQFAVVSKSSQTSTFPVSPPADVKFVSLRSVHTALRWMGFLCSRVLKKYRYTGAGKKPRKRIVQKNGECNVSVANVAKRRRRYLQDIFTTLVDIKWRWTLVVFAMSFLLSWLGFAIVWWVIVYLHGDLEPQHLPSMQDQNSWTPCVINIISFTSCFLFSIETQHTIGYGSRHTTEECPHAIVVMCLQSITGVVIQAFMVGIVFAKLSRPKKRTQTLMFSRNMCIVQRDGELCLMFRVGDIRKSHIIEAHVRAQLIKKHVTQEGEEIPLFMFELDVGYDIGEDRIFFIWPMTIVHKIDDKSPLYDIAAADLKKEDFEIVVLLEGVIESTGMTTQARSSYLPDEILWGHRFEPLVSYKKGPREGFCVDLSLFNNTLPVDMPTCSARELDERSSRRSTDGGDEDKEEPAEDGAKGTDAGSSHSSQVTSLGPMSPHSVDTVATTPLVSPSTDSNNSHGGNTNSNNNNGNSKNLNSITDATVPCMSHGSPPYNTDAAFSYDVSYLPERMEHSSAAAKQQEGPDCCRGCVNRRTGSRHSAACAEGAVVGQEQEQSEGNTSAYRRTISLPTRTNYVQEGNNHSYPQGSQVGVSDDSDSASVYSNNHESLACSRTQDSSLHCSGFRREDPSFMV